MVDPKNEIGNDEEAVARLAQALSHPVRLRILRLLREEGAYVMHLTSMLGRPQANISQHLAILRDTGLVIDERDGMSVIYYVRDQRVFDLLDRLAELSPDAWKGSDEGGSNSSRYDGGSSHGCREGEMDCHGGPRNGGMEQKGVCHCPRCRGRSHG